MSARFALASATVLLTAAAAFAQKTPEGAPSKAALAVGSPAPALTIEKWVKGAPVTGFEPGKVYVVEFWATWCGPCIAGMPHLSELQRQYADKGVTIIGVSSRDERNDLPGVEAMVKEKGDVMDYTVAWDTDRKTNEAYMKAAGRGGIPCSFLVDGSGKIAYIGHPTFLDMPIAQVLAGTWDIEKGNAEVAQAQTTLNAIYKLVPKDPKAAITKIVEFETRFPVFARLVGTLKFDCMVAAGDYDSAYKVAGKLVDDAIAHKNAVGLNELAWKIVDPAVKLERRDLDLALRAAEKAAAFTSEKDGAILDTLARVWFLKGDLKQAIEWQTKAVAAAPEGEMKMQIEATLAEYKAKQAQ